MLEILPETDDNTLIVKAIEKLTSRDYEDIFIPQLNLRLNKLGKLRVLMAFDDNFNGWEPGAAWDDLVFGVQHRHEFEKVAVVGEQKWLQWATKIGAYFMDGQVATYTPDQFQDAVHWVKQRESANGQNG